MVIINYALILVCHGPDGEMGCRCRVGDSQTTRPRTRGAYPSVNIGIMLMESGLLSDLGSMRFPNFQEGVHYGYARTPC